LEIVCGRVRLHTLVWLGIEIYKTHALPPETAEARTDPGGLRYRSRAPFAQRSIIF
jgi:hypothetical protein